MKVGAGFHLTYCTNIHPGETWPEVFEQLQRHVPRVRRDLHEDRPFGIGLRLSARAAGELEAPDALDAFRDFLLREKFYVYTINGFPYGTFHGERIKEGVYQPDWRDPRRLDYSNRLARLLAALLPEEGDIEGSVSTVPVAFKSEIRDSSDLETARLQLVDHACYLSRLWEETGRIVTLALEPEPHCYLETTEETVEFFRDKLWASSAVSRVRNALGCTFSEAEQVLRRHLGVCYDTCHAAVEFEEAEEALSRLEDAGIGIFKLQLSSALRLRFRRGDGAALESLSAFAEDTYLHQVVERSSRGVRRFVDLPQALKSESRPGPAGGETVEWRVHFHVPIFKAELGDFSTTRDHLEAVLERLKHRPPCRSLEVETYTWDVLPSRYREGDVASMLARELSWVRRILEE